LLPMKLKVRWCATSIKWDWPNLGTLPKKVTHGLKLSQFSDRFGLGMMYDPCGMGRVDDECEEHDVCYVGICVPEDYARAAAKKHPGLVTILSAKKWEEWYDTRLARDLLDEDVDLVVLQGIEVRETLYQRGHGEKPDPQRVKDALDPDHPSPGVRKNPRKTWARFSVDAGVELT
ncbi:hypothetical protein LCGC14_0669890, partial [marine sediment metagenome]